MRIPRQKSIQHFKDQIRKRTRRKTPLSVRPQLMVEINPVIRGWGNYFTAKPMSASSSTDSTVGLCVDSGHIAYSRWRNAGLEDASAIQTIR